MFALAEELCNLPDPETAIFIWANQDPEVQKRVRFVETTRVEYLDGYYKTMDLIKSKQDTRQR